MPQTTNDLVSTLAEFVPRLVGAVVVLLVALVVALVLQRLMVLPVAGIFPAELTALRSAGLIAAVGLAIYALARRHSLRNVDVLILLASTIELTIISGTELTDELLATYAGNLCGPLAANELARLRAAGIERIQFAWGGPLEEGHANYWRLHGPLSLVEYDNTQNNANHIHTVWHDLERDFGRDLLREHYETGHRHAQG